MNAAHAHPSHTGLAHLIHGPRISRVGCAPSHMWHNRIHMSYWEWSLQGIWSLQRIDALLQRIESSHPIPRISRITPFKPTNVLFALPLLFSTYADVVETMYPMLSCACFKRVFSGTSHSQHSTIFSSNHKSPRTCYNILYSRCDYCQKSRVKIQRDTTLPIRIRQHQTAEHYRLDFCLPWTLPNF